MYHRRGFGGGPPAAGGFVGSGGPAPSRRAIFCKFFAVFWKKIYFNAIESQFAGVQSHLNALDF